MYTLNYTHEGESYSVPIEKDSVIIGRSSKCDITIKTPSVSAQHVRLDLQGGQVTFRDLLSSNGTKINGEKLAEGTLRAGDILRLGKLEISVSSAAAADDPHATADGTPPDFSAPVPGAYEPEETPPDGNLLPMTVAPAEGGYALAPMPVEVVQPGEPKIITDADKPNKNKRVLMYGVVGALVFTVLVMMILKSPPQDGNPNPPPSTFDYEKDLQRGISAFNEALRGDASRFSIAAQIWQKLDRQRKLDENKVFEDRREAEFFYRATRPFIRGNAGDMSRFNWLQLTDDIEQWFQAHPETDRVIERFARQLNDECFKQSKAQKTYGQIIEAVAAEELDVAEKLLTTLPSSSIYFSAKQGILDKIAQKRFSVFKKESTQEAIQENWANAVRKAQLALAIKADPELAGKIPGWQENDRLERLVKQFRKLANSTETEDWLRAQTELWPQLKPHINNKICMGVSAQKAKVDEKAYIYSLKEIYKTGKFDDLKKQQKDPLARLSKAKAIFSKVDNIETLFASAEKLEKDALKGNVGKLLTARKLWDEVRTLESDNTHPVNKKAKQLYIEKYPLPTIGKMLVDEGIKMQGLKKYKAARDRYELAKSECEMEVDAEIDALKKVGWKLYNSARNMGDGQDYERKITLKLALDCHRPGDGGYQKILDYYNKRYPLGDGD